MFDAHALLVAAPLFGLAAYCVTHVLVCRLVAHRGRYFPLWVGFLAGLGGSLLLGVAASVLASDPPADGAALQGLNLLTYLALAFGYFNFINLNIASLRIRMVEELLEAGGSMSRQELLACYNSNEVASVRLARLLRGGHLREEQGRYYSGKALKFLLVAKIFDGLRWCILGRRCALLWRPDAASSALDKEGTP